MEMKEKVQCRLPQVDDMVGWLKPNMFIATQTYMATDTDGNLCVEQMRYLPES